MKSDLKGVWPVLWRPSYLLIIAVGLEERYTLLLLWWLGAPIIDYGIGWMHIWRFVGLGETPEGCYTICELF
jgi:hypothetical protein